MAILMVLVDGEKGDGLYLWSKDLIVETWHDCLSAAAREAVRDRYASGELDQEDREKKWRTFQPLAALIPVGGEHGMDNKSYLIPSETEILRLSLSTLRDEFSDLRINPLLVLEATVFRWCRWLDEFLSGIKERCGGMKQVQVEGAILVGDKDKVGTTLPSILASVLGVEVYGVDETLDNGQNDDGTLKIERLCPLVDLLAWQLAQREEGFRLSSIFTAPYPVPPRPRPASPSTLPSPSTSLINPPTPALSMSSTPSVTPTDNIFARRVNVLSNPPTPLPYPGDNLPPVYVVDIDREIDSTPNSLGNIHDHMQGGVIPTFSSWASPSSSNLDYNSSSTLLAVAGDDNTTGLHFLASPSTDLIHVEMYRAVHTEWNRLSYLVEKNIIKTSYDNGR